MASLRIHLLGSPRVFHGEDLVSISRQKAQALLVYLAIKPDPQPRSRLAYLLWPDVDDTTARQSLSTSLAALRRALGGHDNAEDEHLVVAGETIALVRRHDYWCDVDAFEAIQRRLERSDAGLGSSSVTQLEAALDMYRGSFLEGLSGREGEGFEEWVLQERTRLELLALDGLRALVAFHERNGAYTRARQLAERSLAIDNLDDAMHVTLLRLLAAGGHHGAARRHFRDAIALLTREFGAVPPRVVGQLRDQLQAGSGEEDGPGEASLSLPEVHPNTLSGEDPVMLSPTGGFLYGWRQEQPVHLVHRGATIGDMVVDSELPYMGRTRQVALVRDAIDMEGAGGPAMIVIEGIAGMGKTRLLREVIDRLPSDRPVVTLACRRLQQAVPFWPLMAARRASGWDDDARTGSGDPALVVESWIHWLLAMAGPTTKTIVLDAAQWSDPWTIRVLDAALSGVFGGAPLLVLGLRPRALTAEITWLLEEGERKNQFLRVQLGPLTQEELEPAMVEQGMNGNDAHDMAAWLVHTTGGFPDVVAAAMPALRDEGIVYDDRGRCRIDWSRLASEYAHDTLPKPAHGVLHRYLDNLDATARDLLAMCGALRGTLEPAGIPDPTSAASAAALDTLTAEHLLCNEQDEWGEHYRLTVPALGRMALDEIGVAQRALLLRRVLA